MALRVAVPNTVRCGWMIAEPTLGCPRCIAFFRMMCVVFDSE